MRYLSLVFVVLFLLAGCTTSKKNIVIKPSKQSTTSKDPLGIFEPYEKVPSQTVSFSSDFKIAIVFPSKVVGKYANNTINTIMGYLLYKNERFEVESFDSVNQDRTNIIQSFQEIKEAGFTQVIALYTKDALADIINIEQTNGMKIYFPLIEKKESAYNYKNFIYGAISYDNQLEKLLTLSNGANAMFYEKSNLGRKLKTAYEHFVPDAIPVKAISKIDTKYKKLVEDESLNESALMLNTPIIKSSIILSQLRANDIKPNIILSTQLNYNPLLVSLTQFEDRVNFITASSIEKTDPVLTETLALLNAEIGYNWVNYSSLVGVNNFFSQNSDNLIKNSIVNNEVVYDVHLYNSTAYGFQPFVIQE